MLDNPFDELKNNRNQILFIELAGLLHDIGKLSQKFLHYRKTWQGDPEGWLKKDPHEHEYLGEHEVFNDLIPDEFQCEISEIASPDSYDFGETDFSIRKAVHDHNKSESVGNITKMLKAADGKDAAIDRNNPLFSAEQNDTIYRSNVFGFEDRIVDYKSQEDARKKLYKDLNKKLAGYFTNFDISIRRSILNKIREAFEQGLSDTTRPQNDTSLWEHSYAVASILKVLAVHNLINKKEAKIYSSKDIKFGIFGVGWDGLGFISYGQKIGDIVSRKNILDEIKKFVKEIIEAEYPVGNTIYEDDNGIYFIVPVHFDKSPYANIRKYLLKRIYKDAAEESSGELQPYLVDILETNTLTSIVRAIKRMREKTSSRFDSTEEEFEYFTEHLQKFQSEKTVCPICRLRSVEKEDIDKKICEECKKRRMQAAASKKTDAKQQTVFIDETVDNNRGAALIVARFDLRDWLDGNMIRSLFVSEPKGIQKEIESLGKIKAFQVDIEKELRKKFETTEYDYNRIKKDIDSFNPDSVDKKRAKKTAFLYVHGRREIVESSKVCISQVWKDWQGLLDDAREEIDDSRKEDILLYNILNAKSPTPSTILDVWLTTLHFFKREVSEIFSNELKDFFPQVNRLRIKTKEDMSSWKDTKGTLEAELISKTGARKKVEILIENETSLEVIGEQYSSDDVKTSDLARVDIIDKNHPTSGKKDNRVFTVEEYVPGDSFVQYRVITETPNIYMAIVPANTALDVTSSIYKRYRERFGKVIGRLSLSIGNVFFRTKIPMFVVLDSGRRMLGNFERLANKKEKVFFDVMTREDTNTQKLNMEAVLGMGNQAYKRTIQWDLHSKLGSGEEDYYHPYFFVDSNNKNMSARPTYFSTVAGDVVHFTEIEVGDKLCLQPNFYDFEFLDSNIRRHDIGLDKDLRRGSSVASFRSKPFLMDELDQKIVHIWRHLIQSSQLPDITDAKLRNLQSLWLTKYQEWGVNLDNPDTDGFQRWMEFVEASIDKEFPGIDEQAREILWETIKNGVFFDMLELYLSILKMKVQPK